MTKLEMIYLMNVALHLPTLEDVKTFEQINKKSSQAINSLKELNINMDLIKYYKEYNDGKNKR